MLLMGYARLPACRRLQNALYEAFLRFRERFEACQALHVLRLAPHSADARLEACRRPYERFPACRARHERPPVCRLTGVRIEACRWRCEPLRASRLGERFAVSHRRREPRLAPRPPDEPPGASLPGAPWPERLPLDERIEAFHPQYASLPEFHPRHGHSSSVQHSSGARQSFVRAQQYSAPVHRVMHVPSTHWPQAQSESPQHSGSSQVPPALHTWQPGHWSPLQQFAQ